MREVATSLCVSFELANSPPVDPSPRLHACAWTMVDLQTEALIGIAVIGIALVSFGLYPIAKLALSQRKPRSARVSANSEERDGGAYPKRPPRKPACRYEME